WDLTGNAEDECEDEVVIPVPEIINICNEDYTISLLIDGIEESLVFPLGTEITKTLGVGQHTIEWIITDASGNPTSCTQTVTIRDESLAIDCPGNESASVDDGE